MRGLGGRPRLVRYDVNTALWRAKPLTLAVLTDLHICTPWSSLSALDQLVDQILAEAPYLILLPGDFLARNVVPSWFVPIEPIAAVLSRLQAPLGVYASLGNHDWRDCPIAKSNEYRINGVEPALEAAGIPVLSNRSVPLTGSTWLVGLDSQQGIGRPKDPDPRHDLARAFADVPEGASVVLMAHEPDIFLDHDYPAALQVSGHTHAGQINLFGRRPATPSRYGGRLAHGLHAEGDRRLIVSAGLGYTGPPVRFRAPPEWVVARVAARGGE